MGYCRVSLLLYLMSNTHHLLIIVDMRAAVSIRTYLKWPEMGLVGGRFL